MQLRFLVFSCLAALALSGTATCVQAASVPVHEIEGRWQLNAAESDDGEAILAERIDRERKERDKWLARQRREAESHPGASDGENEVRPPPPNRYERRREQEELVHRMLGFTNELSIKPAGASLDLQSDMESRRVEPDSRSQVSLPEGELADSEVSWSSGQLVISRRVKRGPSVVEKFRWLKKTNQLEYTIAWSGDTWLQGIRIRRVFDRSTAPPPVPANPALGPVP
jgi:hypothetical protein